MGWLPCVPLVCGFGLQICGKDAKIAVLFYEAVTCNSLPKLVYNTLDARVLPMVPLRELLTRLVAGL